MSFVWFRKYHKPFLWFAVIFTIVVFATFSGMSDLKTMLSGHPSDRVVGEFTVAGTGAVSVVSIDDFQRVRTELNRWNYLVSRGGSINDDFVWAHIIALTDARAAGLNVADSDVSTVVTRFVGQMVQPGVTPTKDDYRQLWSTNLQFPSARDFEEFIRGLLLANRYREVTVEAAGLVDADEVYLRWRADNELFDVDAVVIPDVELDKVPDPTPEVLAAWWDAMPEANRDARFVEPQKQDIVYAWLPLDAGPELIADELLAALAEPDPQEVEGRFQQFRTTRWPDANELDDTVRAAIVRELKIVALAQKAQDEFEARTDKAAATFIEAMTAAGLKVVNPEGEIGPEQLKSLEGIGDETLQYWLGQRKAGETHFGYPYGGQNFVDVVYVETVTPSHPLSFEAAHDAAVKAWKELQRDKPAEEFREKIRSATRALPEVAAVLAPLIEAADKRADEAVAAATELDDAAKAALRSQMLADSETNDIVPRLAEYEHLVWKDIPLPGGARRIELKDVSHAYARKPDDALEAANSIERFLKTNGAIFRLGVDAISEPLRHAASNQSVVVEVVGRSFPDKAVMLGDPASLEVARNQLAAQRQNEANASFAADIVKTSHHLKLAAKPEVN